MNYAAFAIVISAMALLESNHSEGHTTRKAAWLYWAAILCAFWLFWVSMFGQC